MHVVFWTVTQPVNRHWLVDTDLTRPAQRFFSVEKNANPRRGELDHWERLRDRWEYSHIVRAVLASISLVAVTIAIALYGRSVS